MIKQQSKILLLGIALAAIVFIVGQLLAFVARSELTSLIETCKQSPTESRFGGSMLCEPSDFRYPYPTSGIQAQILAEDRGIRDVNEVFLWVSAAIVLLAALPWAWYFLLQRIRELSNALMGRNE